MLKFRKRRRAKAPGTLEFSYYISASRKRIIPLVFYISGSDSNISNAVRLFLSISLIYY